MLLRYFGEKNEHNCMQCDVCLQKHQTGLKEGEFQELKNQILEKLNTSSYPVAELLSQLNADKEKVNTVISFLLSEEIIRIKNGILSS